MVSIPFPSHSFESGYRRCRRKWCSYEPNNLHCYTPGFLFLSLPFPSQDPLAETGERYCVGDPIHRPQPWNEVWHLWRRMKRPIGWKLWSGHPLCFLSPSRVPVNMLYTESEVIDRAVVNVSVSYRGSMGNAEVRVLWPYARVVPKGSNPRGHNRYEFQTGLKYFFDSTFFAEIVIKRLTICYKGF